MNPTLAAALGSILRHFLTSAAAVLTAKGIWTGAEAETYVAAAVLGILGLGWSLYKKFLADKVAQWLGVTALCLSVGLSGACASVNGALVVAEDAVHDSLAKADDKVRAICTGPQAAQLTAPCNDARPIVREALAAGQAFNVAVTERKVETLQPLIAAVGRLSEAVKKLPQGETAGIVTDLAAAVAAAYKEVQQ